MRSHLSQLRHMYTRRIGITPAERSSLRWAYETLSALSKAGGAGGGEADYLATLHRWALDEAAALGIDPIVLTTQRRNPSEVSSRRRIWAALRARGLSYPEIGLATGHAHATVYFALKLSPRAATETSA